MRKLKLYILPALFIAGLTSCLQANNPPSKVMDPNPGNERIYGEVDGPPKQSLLEYEKLPDEIQRANKVKKILYPN